MKKIVPVLIIVALANISFAQDPVQEPTKMEQLRASHDEVMDEMPKLAKLINKLQAKAKASYDKKKYENAVQDLKSANRSMMTWMTDFGNRFDADEMLKGKKLGEEKQKWLVEEEEKMVELKEEINLSITRAEALVGE